MLCVDRKLVLAVRSVTKPTQQQVWPALHKRRRSCHPQLPTCLQIRLSKPQTRMCRAHWPIIPTPVQCRLLHHPMVQHCCIRRSRRLRLRSATCHPFLCFSACHCHCSSRSSSQFLYTFNNRCSAVCRHRCRTNWHHSWDHQHQIMLHHFL